MYTGGRAGELRELAYSVNIQLQDFLKVFFFFTSLLLITARAKIHHLDVSWASLRQKDVLLFEAEGETLK